MIATVLFTDIVGSTERAAELGDRGWRELLQRHHAVIRVELVDALNGKGQFTVFAPTDEAVITLLGAANEEEAI